METKERVNKYIQLRVIQHNYGYGWEDNSEYTKEEKELCMEDFKEYRLTGYPTRIVIRRVLNPLHESYNK